MAAFEIAAVLVVAAGVGIAAWTALPSLLMESDGKEEDDPVFTVGDVAIRMAELEQRLLRLDDDPTPWVSDQLRTDATRIPADMSASPAVPLLMADPPHLLPLSTCLLLLPNAPEVVIGRRQGRPLHAVRLQGDLFLDLYEALRLLPVIGIELDGRGISAPVELFASPDALPPGELAVIAPWLMSDHGKRVIATDPGRRTFEVEICGRLLKATVWMPAITEGIQNDTLAWAGQIQLDEHRCTGATPTSLLDRLELSPTEPVGWTRTELLELAAILQQIESQNVDVSPFVLEVFADRAIPLPNLDDEREYLLTAALLNWVGAAHRKAGRPRAALAALDAAARATSPTDDDSRADILHNQGLAHLDLRDQEEGALDRAVEAFQRSAQLHPTDDAPWIQLALIALLRDDLPAAEEAWMQAATRATNPDHYSVFMANAGAAAQG